MSVSTLLAIVVFSGNRDLVTDAVWVRGSILVVASLIRFALGVSTANGSCGNYRRVRLIASAQVVAIVLAAAASTSTRTAPAWSSATCCWWPSPPATWPS